MDAGPVTTPLYAHTYESLCQTLLSGDAVDPGGGKPSVALTNPDSRSILAWYLSSTDAWLRTDPTSRPKSVRDDHLAALVARVAQPPPDPTPAPTRAAREPRTLCLKRLRAHRFAGIHLYGTPGTPPPDFEFIFDHPLTLIQGKNGAGKTAFLNAITWCLTGFVHRSGRQPEKVGDPIGVRPEVVPDPASPTLPQSLDITSITPLPPAATLASFGGNVPLDTWVELELVEHRDDRPPASFIVRRELRRASRTGKPEVIQSGFEALGLDPIALDVCTRMPGLIPYIQVGGTSSLSKAIATLTGLRPFEDLAVHARRVKEKLDDDKPKLFAQQVSKFAREFDDARRKVEEAFAEHPDIRPGEFLLPTGLGDSTAGSSLTVLREATEATQTARFAEARRVLGGTFNAADHAHRVAVRDLVPDALAALTHLVRLPAFTHLGTLKSVPVADCESVEALMALLIAEAEDLAAVEASGDIAHRMRLYERVAGWLRETHAGVPDDCPVCLSSLLDRRDPVSGKSIQSHLGESLESATEHASLTPARWAEAAIRRLKASIPDSLAAVLGQQGRDTPSQVLRLAFTRDIFEAAKLSGVLRPLADAARVAAEQILVDIPDVERPAARGVSASLVPALKHLRDEMARIDFAIASVRWRRTHDDQFKVLFTTVVKPAASSGDNAATSAHPAALVPRLEALRAIVLGARPLEDALEGIAAMARAATAYDDAVALREHWRVAAAALGPLGDLDALVSSQVDELMRTVGQATREWKTRLYRAPHSRAPSVASIQIDSDGRLDVLAAAGGTVIEAQHVANASDLRATLLALLIAFWQKILSERGGLAFLLLDDPHELFDPENRERLARAVVHLLAGKHSAVVTSNDDRFAREISVASGGPGGSLDRREVLPSNGVRPRMELGRFREDIDQKRRHFDTHFDDHAAARDYVCALRSHLENRLLDSLESWSFSPSDKPTLSPILGELRSQRRNGVGAAAALATMATLLDHKVFLSGSEFLRLMNKAHHSDATLISYNEVLELSHECKHSLDLVESAALDRIQWLRRDTPATPADRPAAPPLATPTERADVPFVERLAAYSAGGPLPELGSEEERFDLRARLGSHALYRLHTPNLGLAAPEGSWVIVRLGEEEVEENRLVVALHGHRAFARRLVRPRGDTGYVTLASEIADPRRRVPSIRVNSGEVRLLKIVGVVLDASALPPSRMNPDRHEAVLGPCKLLDRVDLVFRVEGTSALPIALPKQPVLAGRQISPSDLPRYQGQIIALATSEGNVLKRVGPCLPKAPNVRVFVPVGSDGGESLIVRTEALADEADAFTSLPLALHMREIIGVLYDQG